MKEFFRNGFDLILKQIISQLGMTIFGVSVVLTVGHMAGQNSPWLLAASGLSIALYLFLIYIHTWEYGAKEKIKIDGGRMKYEPLKGLYIALVSNSLNILLAILVCIGYYSFDFVTLTPNFAGQMFEFSNTLIRSIEGMYVGIIVYFFKLPATTPPYIFLIITLPAIITSFLAYYFGSNNKRLFPSKNTSGK
ncbi:MAG: hypothetical protein IKL40_00985 [Clostridia bacterium]|nr:hypothetical protein [Clostridia bacterium]